MVCGVCLEIGVELGVMSSARCQLSLKKEDGLNNLFYPNKMFCHTRHRGAVVNLSGVWLISCSRM